VSGWELLGGIGSVASVVSVLSAVYSSVQAKKSRGSASESKGSAAQAKAAADKVKKQYIIRDDMKELAELATTCKSISADMMKYNSNSDDSEVASLNHREIAKSVSEFMIKMGRVSSRSQSLKDAVAGINEQLEKFVDSTSGECTQSVGWEIRIKLDIIEVSLEEKMRNKKFENN